MPSTANGSLRFWSGLGCLSTCLPENITAFLCFLPWSDSSPCVVQWNRVDIFLEYTKCVFVTQQPVGVSRFAASGNHDNTTQRGHLLL